MITSGSIPYVIPLLATKQKYIRWCNKNAPSLSIYVSVSVPACVSPSLFSFSLTHSWRNILSYNSSPIFSSSRSSANPLVPAKMYNCDRFMLIIGRFERSQYHPLFTYRPKPMIDRQYAPHVRIMISSANINTAHA